MDVDHWKAGGRNLIEEITVKILVRRDTSDIFAGYAEMRAALPIRYSGLVAAFERNILAVEATVGVPLTLASAAAEGSQWQRIHTAERIRAQKLRAEPGESESALEKRRNAHALSVASERMREFVSSPDGAKIIAADACRFLLQALDSSNLSAAADELLLQGAVLTWSALEILARDLFEAIVNADPKRAIAVMEEAGAKQRMQWKFTLEELAASNFNLSSSLGSLLASQQDFSDLRTIKAVMLPAVNFDPAVVVVLGDRRLWLLCQQRHLIVHRRGVIDARYLEATSEARAISERLVIKPVELESYMDAVVLAGKELLTAASKHAT